MKYDRYGFVAEHEAQCVVDNTKEADEPLPSVASDPLTVAQELEKKDNLSIPSWCAMLAQFEYTSMCHPMQLRTRVIAGIPHSVRERAWPLLLGAESKAKKFDSRYYERLSVQANAAFEEQIRVDVLRTFPQHELFAQNVTGVESDGRRQLTKVLTAYSHHNTEIGYCQGLSYIAATLMMQVKDPRLTFWCLVALLQKTGTNDGNKTGKARTPMKSAKGAPATTASKCAMSRLFDPQLSGMQLVGHAFEHLLLSTQYKQLHLHLLEHGCEPLLYITPWFMTCFTHVQLPWETVLRIWDLMCLDGLDALFRVSLAILHLLQKDLLQNEGLEKLLPVLLQLPCPNIRDADELLACAEASVPPVFSATLLHKAEHGGLLTRPQHASELGHKRTSSHAKVHIKATATSLSGRKRVAARDDNNTNKSINAKRNNNNTNMGTPIPQRTRAARLRARLQSGNSQPAFLQRMLVSLESLTTPRKNLRLEEVQKEEVRPLPMSPGRGRVTRTESQVAFDIFCTPTRTIAGTPNRSTPVTGMAAVVSVSDVENSPIGKELAVLTGEPQRKRSRTNSPGGSPLRPMNREASPLFTTSTQPHQIKANNKASDAQHYSPLLARRRLQRRPSALSPLRTR